MQNLFIIINILGIAIMSLGAVFIDEIVIRVVVVLIGSFLSGIRIEN